jgi:hypothetical protein
MALGEGVIGGKSGPYTGVIGGKNWGSRVLGGKLGDRSPGAGRTGFRMIPYATGAGNMQFGDRVAGNTHSAVANGQRDGQPTEYRKSFSQISRVEKRRRGD